MDKDEVCKRIKVIIVTVLNLQIDPNEISNDGLLFGDSSSIDSSATLEIICAIEEDFGIEVADEDLRVELFVSVSSIADYMMAILTRTGAQAVK